jgi:hypothetical protein
MIQSPGSSTVSSISSSRIAKRAPYFLVFLSNISLFLRLGSSSGRPFLFFLGTGLRFKVQPLLSHARRSFSCQSQPTNTIIAKKQAFFYFAKIMTILEKRPAARRLRDWYDGREAERPGRAAGSRIRGKEETRRRRGGRWPATASAGDSPRRWHCRASHRRRRCSTGTRRSSSLDRRR